MTQKEEDFIDEIIENFDWECVAKTMEFLGWTWVNGSYNTEFESEIPKIGKLVKRARELLVQACKDDHLIVGSGGFHVTRERNENRETVYLSLNFIIADWEAYDEL